MPLPDIHSSRDRDVANTVVVDAVRRYIAKRHRMVDAFVDDNFTFRASLRLHRRALGWDLLRAPINVLLVLPTVMLYALAWGCEKVGLQRAAAWLRRRNWFLDTAVGLEVERRICHELLQLPLSDADVRCGDVDPLAEEILRDARVREIVEAALVRTGRQGAAGQQRSSLLRALANYKETRTAAAELTNAFLLLGAGALALGQFTPGAVSLGPLLAAVLARRQAIDEFPLGETLGGFWYGAFPPAPSLALVVTSSVVLVLAVASLAAFAGVIADPIQRWLGLHRRRLHRLLDTLERNLTGDDSPFAARDHYITRLIDLMDVARSMLRQ